VNKNIQLCKTLGNVKDYCENIYKKEWNNYDKLDCNELMYLKNKCEDKLNFENKKCNIIHDELKKRRCKFEKRYEQAIKNKDVSFCNSLPRVQKTECLKKMK